MLFVFGSEKVHRKIYHLLNIGKAQESGSIDQLTSNVMAPGAKGSLVMFPPSQKGNAEGPPGNPSSTQE